MLTRIFSESFLKMGAKVSVFFRRGDQAVLIGVRRANPDQVSGNTLRKCFLALALNVLLLMCLDALF